MNRALALVLVLSLAVLARHVGGDGAGRFATMALGFVLIVAAIVGEALEHLRLPRLTGYLLVGLCVGPSVLNVVTPGMATQLRLVNGLAVALIAFSAGLELDLARLHTQLRSLVRHGVMLLGFIYAGLFLAMLAATQVLPFTAGEPWSRRIAISLMTAAVMTTFSPTVVMAVLSETRARGPVSERLLRLVILGDLGVVVIFTAATTMAHVLDGGRVNLLHVVGHVSWEVLGSLVVGSIVGVAVWGYQRFVNQRTGLVLAGVCVVVAEAGRQMGLSPLLCCLAAGFVARNLEPEAAHEMEELLVKLQLPVLVVFFAAAGASLDIEELKQVAPLALALVAVRATLIVGGNRIAAPRAGIPPEVARFLPYGLVSQAGVALGLAVIVGREFSGWGKILETLFVAAISLHEMIGPIVLRRALGQAGELPDAREADESATAVSA